MMKKFLSTRRRRDITVSGKGDDDKDFGLTLPIRRRSEDGASAVVDVQDDDDRLLMKSESRRSSCKTTNTYSALTASTASQLDDDNVYPSIVRDVDAEVITSNTDELLIPATIRSPSPSSNSSITFASLDDSSPITLNNSDNVAEGHAINHHRYRFQRRRLSSNTDTMTMFSSVASSITCDYEFDDATEYDNTNSSDYNIDQHSDAQVTPSTPGEEGSRRRQRRMGMGVASSTPSAHATPSTSTATRRGSLSDCAPRAPVRTRSPVPPHTQRLTTEKCSNAESDAGCSEGLPVVRKPFQTDENKSKPLEMSDATAEECALYGYEDAGPDVKSSLSLPKPIVPRRSSLVVGRGAAPRRSSMKHSLPPSTDKMEQERVRTPRRASITVGSNFQTNCEFRRASISFASKLEEVELIEPMKALLGSDESMASDLWYNKDEIKMIRKENKVLVKQEVLGIMSPRETLRGLESKFTPGDVQWKKQKKIWENILSLQQYQKHTGQKDEEYMRRLSMFYTREAMETASKRGVEDAEEIQKSLSENQKQYRRMSIKF